MQASKERAKSGLSSDPLSSGASVRRILVVGCRGSGKSTLAKKLAGFVGAPHVDLDSHYWQPGWQPTPDSEWLPLVRELCADDAWIMDGTYLSALAPRLGRAQLTLFLDFPRAPCLLSAFRRYLEYRGTNRPGLPIGCPENLDFDFARYIWNYQRDVSPHVHRALQSHPHRVFRSRAEVEAWFERLCDR